MKKVNRVLSLILAMVMLVCTLTACGDTKASEQGKNNTTDAKYKEDITIIMDGTLPSLNRFQTGVETNACQRLNWCLFDTILYEDDNGEIKPNLATEWSTEDGLVYTFKLRDDVVFHNGEKFKADDVVYTLERARDASGTTMNTYIGKYIDHVEAVNDTEVKVYLNTVYSGFLKTMTIPYASVSNRKACEADPEQGMAVGTGPWKLVNFVANEVVKMERNEDYWGEKPKTKTLTWKFVQEQLSRMMMLETGEVQAALGLSSTADWPAIEADDSFQFIPVVNAGVYYLCCNMTNPITGDINFRKAVASVMDRENYVKVGFNGYATPYTDLAYWSLSVPGKNTNISMIPYNIDKAKEYLAASNYNGEEITISVSTTTAGNVVVAQLLQEALMSIGVNAKVNQTDAAGLASLTMYSENKSMLVINSQPWPLGAMNLTSVFSPGVADNRASYSNDKITDLLQKVIVEIDPEKRDAMFKEIRALEAEDIAYLPMYCKIDAFGALKGVDGIRMQPSGFHDVSHIYMIEE